jgi:hypothetical protein
MPEDWARLDGAVQESLRTSPQEPTSVAAALAGGNGPRRLAEVVAACAEKFLAERLSLPDDAAAFWLSGQPDQDTLDHELTAAWQAARPALGDGPANPDREVALLLTPASGAGQRLREAARRVLPAAHTGPTGNPEEIVFYREEAGLALGEAEQRGLVSREAYDQACAAEPALPHTRHDVAWRELRSEVARSQ